MFYLQYIGETIYDLDNDNSLFQVLYSTTLLISCITNMILLSSVSQEFDDWSKALSTSMAAVQCTVGSLSAFVSRIVVLCNMKYKYHKFRTTLESFEIYIPMTTTSMNRKKWFAIIVMFVMLTIVGSANIIKVYFIKSKHIHPTLMTMYFFFYYFHNLSLCFTELHFVIQCFTAYLKFWDINKKLQNIHNKYKNSYITKYPFLETNVETPHSNKSSPRVILYEKDFYCPKDKGYPLANTIELLRIKHWLTREALNDLNSIFGIQIGMSMITITTTALFDLYTQIFYTYTNSMFSKSIFRSNLLFILWILQYSFRYCIIVVTSHVTTKQVINALKTI